MNDFLRRKSFPGKVIHRLRPRGHHPASAHETPVVHLVDTNFDDDKMIGANFPTRSWLAQTFEGANLTGATCPSGKTYGQPGANC